MTELSYEREAMQNNPMPDGLSLLDQLMYQNLALLYYRYHCGAITREQAKAVKGKLLFSYDRKQRADKVASELAEYQATTIRCTEGVHNQYRKIRRRMKDGEVGLDAEALAAADLLSDAIDGRLRTIKKTEEDSSGS